MTSLQLHPTPGPTKPSRKTNPVTADGSIWPQNQALDFARNPRPCGLPAPTACSASRFFPNTPYYLSQNF